MAETWIERARARMDELGLAQNDLMETLGVNTRGAVGHYLTGRREPSIKQLAALASRLGMPPGELIFGKSRPSLVDLQLNRDLGLGAVSVLGQIAIRPDGIWADFSKETASNREKIRFFSEDVNAFALDITAGPGAGPLRPGWIVIVEPTIPSAEGDIVLANHADGRTAVLELLRYRDPEYLFLSLTGAERIQFTKSDFPEIFRVAGILTRSYPA